MGKGKESQHLEKKPDEISHTPPFTRGAPWHTRQSWGSAANPEHGRHQSHRPSTEGSVAIEGWALRLQWGLPRHQLSRTWTLSWGREHPVVAVPCHQVPLPKHSHHTCCSAVNILQEGPGPRTEPGALPDIPHGPRARSGLAGPAHVPRLPARLHSVHRVC